MLLLKVTTSAQLNMPDSNTCAATVTGVSRPDIVLGLLCVWSVPAA